MFKTHIMQHPFVYYKSIILSIFSLILYNILAYENCETIIYSAFCKYVEDSYTSFLCACGFLYIGSVTSSDSGHSTISQVTNSSGDCHSYQQRCISPTRHPPPVPGMYTFILIVNLSCIINNINISKCKHMYD